MGDVPEPDPVLPRPASIELIEALSQYMSESLVLVDPGGRIIFGLGPAGGVLGHGDRIGSHLVDHAHPDDLPHALAAMVEILAEPGRQDGFVGRARHVDGTWRAVELFAANRLDDPLLRAVVVRTRDISGQEPHGIDSGVGLVESLAEVVPEPIVVADHRGHVLFANSAAEQLLGSSLAALREGDALAWVVDADRSGFEAAVAPVQHGAGETRLSFRVAGAAGERWVDARVVGHRGRPDVPSGWVAALSDVTDRRETERQLYHLATHDTLTGLLNRAAFEDRLRAALTRAARDGEDVSLLYVDLSGFKAVNDRYGHRVGDDVLIEDARRLLTTLRETEPVGRHGGDEFAVLVEGAPIDGASTLGRRIEAALAAPIAVAGATVHIGADVGIATAPPVLNDVAALIEAADRAMYETKRGRAAQQ
jgi:diguanylate cyclase (GGDEF)-like protein/PAS domain S-box-containing protein